MEFIWQFIKSNAGAAIGSAGGLAAGVAGGIYLGGGLGLTGILAGLAGGMVAATAGYFAGGAIDTRRHDGHDFHKVTENSPLASKQLELTPTSASYAVKLTPQMWQQIRKEVGPGLTPEQKEAMDMAERLSKKMQAEFKGTQSGDTFTLSTLQVEGVVDPVSFPGQAITFKVKDKAIDFSHPETVVGFDKLVSGMYAQRAELFSKTRTKLQPVIDMLKPVAGDPNPMLNKIGSNIRLLDPKNPAHTVVTDWASSVIGYEFMKDMAEKHGTEGFKTVYKHKMMRFVDPAKGLDEAKIDAVVDAMAKHYSVDPALRKMTPENAVRYMLEKLPELKALTEHTYQIDPRFPPSPANSYSMRDYALELVFHSHKPLVEGFEIRSSGGKVVRHDPQHELVPTPEKPTLLALADDFKSGKFDAMPTTSQPLPAAKKDDFPATSLRTCEIKTPSPLKHLTLRKCNLLCKAAGCNFPTFVMCEYHKIYSRRLL